MEGQQVQNQQDTELGNTKAEKWTFRVQEDDKTKELYISFPDSVLNQVGWDVGDTLIWEEIDHGWQVSKKEQ